MCRNAALIERLTILGFAIVLIMFAHCDCKNPFSSYYIPFLTSFGSYGSGDSNFNRPMGIDDKFISLMVADYGNNRAVKYDAVATTYEAKWGTLGTGDGEFDGPTDVAMYCEGPNPKYVYVVDSGNSRIQKFDGAGSFLAKWGTLGTGDGEFDNPVCVTVDDEGYVYVTDYGNNRIQKFDSTGVFILKWGSEGTGNGQFDGPYGIAFEGDENYNPKYIYVTDQGNHRVQVFTRSGEFIRAFGSYGSGEGQLNSPSGITVQDGQSYIADTDNCRYVVFNINGKFLGKGGVQGTGDGQFSKPVGITKDGLPLFVSDEEQHKILVFDRNY